MNVINIVFKKKDITLFEIAIENIFELKMFRRFIENRLYREV